jgi:Protein of unknown function (DUF3489)
MAEVGLRWWRQVMPQKPKEFTMREPNSKRRSNSSKTAKQNKAARTTARKPVKLKRGTLSAVGQLHRSSAKQTERAESKQARILDMLRTPSGATIDAMVHTTGWQQHSVRGFLAGVVRKKLGLNLVSEATESGRLYRIIDRSASGTA